MIKLEIKERKSKSKREELADGGLIPAVFYGRKEKSTPISVSLAQFKKVWKESGESTVLTLEGVGDEKEVLIHDVDTHPVTGEPRHADFYVIEKGKKVEVSVPLNFIGVSPAVKDKGGILVKVIHELDISAFPKDLPHEIDVDVSMIKDFETHILAKDIKLPEGVTLEVEEDEVVALVSEAREETEEETEPVDLSEIEVEKKGKEKEEEGEGGEAEKKEEKAE